MVVDLLSIVPTCLSLGLEGAQSLLIVRSLRLVRMFRVLKFGHFVSEARLLREALSADARYCRLCGALLNDGCMPKSAPSCFPLGARGW